MANNKIQVKRTNTSGRTANVTNVSNTQYIDAGEFALNMADGILYTSNGSALITVGANQVNQRITNTLTIDNNKPLRFATVNSSAVAYFIQQNDDNFVFYTTDASYAARPVWSIFANSSSSALGFGTPINFNGANVNFGTTRVYANGTSGTAGQVLTSNGTATYWSTVSGGSGSVNTDAQYTWKNTQTFQANVSFTGNGIGLTTNTGAIYLGGIADANWKIGRNTGVTTKWKYTNNTIDIITANSNLEGFAIGLVSGNTYFETGYLGTYIASNVTIGNSTVNLTINSTAFTGTANNTSFVGSVSAANVVSNAQLSGNLANYQTTAGLSANVATLTSNNSAYLGGVAAASYVQNTDSRTLSGNLYFTGANVVYSSGLKVGSNVVLNTSVISLGDWVKSNTSTISIGNSSVAVSANLNNGGLILRQGSTQNTEFNSSGYVSQYGNAYIDSTVYGTSASLVVQYNMSGAPFSYFDTRATSNSTYGGFTVDYYNGTASNFTANVNLYANGNSGVLSLGGSESSFNANTSRIYIGNSSANATVNSTVYTGSANNTSFVGSVSAANVVSNAQLSGNLANYQTTAGLSSNVATLTANNATYFGGYTWAAPAILGSTTANGASLTYANVSGQVNTATLYAATSANIASIVQANSLGVHVGANVVANTTALKVGNTTLTTTNAVFGGTIAANGDIGSAGQALISGGAANAYWSSIGNGTVTSVASGNGITGGTITGSGTLYVTEGSGLSVNSTGVHVKANNGIVSNSTGTFAKAANGISVDSSGINVVAGNTQLVSNTTGVWIDQTKIDHNSLSNYDANKHVDHTAVSITAGSGLTGGGTIAASRTIDVGAGNGISVAADAVYVNGGSTTTVNTTGVHVNSTLLLQTLTTTGNATIGGNLTINGNVTVIGANNLSIVDNFLYLNSNNTTQNIDIGFAGNYNDGTYKHTGFFRDATDGYWKPFDGYTPEPDAAVDIDTSNNTFNIAGMWIGNTRIGNTTVYATVNSTVYSGTANNSTNFGGYTWAAPGLLGSSTANGASFTYANVSGQINTATLYTTGMATFANSTTQSNTAASAWFTGGTGTIGFDTYMIKRISWNDGAGNFNIRAGHYYNGTSTVYVNDGTSGGAASIIMSSDAVDGAITFTTYPIGTQGATVPTGTTAYLNTSAFYVSANIYAGSLLVANSTVVNATHLAGYTLAAPSIIGSGTANGASFTYANVSGQVNTATFYATTSANVGANVQLTTSTIKVGNTTLSTTNAVFGGTIAANGGIGTAGYGLFSGGAANAYWSTVVTSVASGNGITGGTITQTGTLYVSQGDGISVNSTGVHVKANTGIVANSTGTFVNSSYIATLTANDATNFGGYTWASPGLLGSGTANAASFTYANVSGQVNTATLYATTSANVGANVQLTTSVVSVGNSTANVRQNSTTILAQTNTTVNASMTASLVQVANSTGIANLTATSLVIGGTTVSGSSATIAGFANVSGNGQFTGNVGIGAAPQSTVGLYLTKTWANNADGVGASFVTTDSNTALTAGRTKYATQTYVYNTNQNKSSDGLTSYASAYYGNYIVAYNGNPFAGTSQDANAALMVGQQIVLGNYANGVNANTLTTARGGYNLVQQAGTSKITTAEGMRSRVLVINSTSANITTAYSYIAEIYANTNTSTVETGYLYYGNYIVPAAAGTRYGVWVQNEQINYFSNNVGIGNTAPAFKLRVDGTTSLAGAVSDITTLAAGNTTLTGWLSAQSAIITGGGSYVAGSIYSDSNWGMLFRAKQASPTQANFAWKSSDDTTEYMRIAPSGNVGIGTTSPSYTLQVNGSFAATTKSFVIDHPTKTDMKLRYGSLEGPENGVYVRGKLEGSSTIELPDYWWNLIDPESITVNLTPYGSSQDLWVQSTSAYIINLNQPANCFFTVYAERKDVDKLVVEF